MKTVIFQGPLYFVLVSIGWQVTSDYHAMDSTIGLLVHWAILAPPTA